MKYSIETINLMKRYKQKLAVDSLHLRVPQDSVFCLVGENGAGKTTTLSMISGVVRPTLGNVKILDRDIQKTNVIKESVGIELQNSNFEMNNTVMENLLYLAALKGVPKEKRKDTCKEIIKKINLEEYENNKIRELSHGTVKMLGIGQTLLGNPKIILLDEPSAGLDPKVFHDLKRLIKGMKNKTVLLTSHNLDFVSEVCDYVGIVHNGHLMIQDKIKKLIHGGTLEKVFLDIIGKK